MRRRISSALLLSGAIVLVSAASVLADNPGAGISVEPSEVTAGQTVLLAGNSLEPNDERVLVLQGETVAISLGTATTDADGMLSQEILIPAHLPSGVYQLQAIGDETLVSEVKVTAAEGGATVTPPNEAALTARDRSPLEFGLIFAFVAVTAVLGALLVWRAERFRGISET
ncbi:MAG: hypothetical protein HYX54_08045 [Chloroflexi bacterium]|nr:hypothetical protein [Chloroflexota bacterium]